MIDALIQGKILGQAVSRVGSNGNPYVTCRVRVPIEGGEAIFANVITFKDEVCATLKALQDGDSIALTGSLTVKIWTDKEGNPRPSVDMMAHGALTPYQVQHKRQAVHTTGKDASARAQSFTGSSASGERAFSSQDNNDLDMPDDDLGDLTAPNPKPKSKLKQGMPRDKL